MNTAVRFEKTGEIRCPKAGEWFEGYKGNPEWAKFTFTEQKFPILRRVLIDGE